MNGSTKENVRNIKIVGVANERTSGVELLRIISIFLICISHAVQTSQGFIDCNKLSAGTLILTIMSYFGQMGNILFIICSSWFLLDSNWVKIEKIFKILLDSMFISIMILLCFVISGYKLTFGQVIMQIFPDFFGNLWFIPIYVLFYMVHPLLNHIITTINKKTHFTFCLITFLLYGLFNCCFGWGMGIGNVDLFIFIYFVVAFIKKYCQTFYQNRKLSLFMFIFFLLMFICFVLYQHFFKIGLQINALFSPFLVPMLLCLFNIFNSLKIRSKFVNYVASCTLFIYCFHENMLLRSIIRPQYYKYFLTINYNMYVGWVMLCGLGMFVSGVVIALLYRLTFSKLTVKLSKILELGFVKLNNAVYDIFFKE